MNDHAKFETTLEETDLSQIEFIKELKSGSEKAFGRLIEENQKKVYRIALSFVKNPTDAEDIAQEVFIRVYTSIGNFKGNSSLSTWIYKITYNLSLDFLKRNNKKLKTILNVHTNLYNGIPHSKINKQKHGLQTKVQICPVVKTLCFHCKGHGF